MTQLAIAPHLREPIFRAYEDLLAIAVGNWPLETSFNVPAGVATATFLANFRNSIVSVINYDWKTKLDKAKLKALRVEKAYIICYKEDGKLHFCHPKPRAVKPITTTTASEKPKQKLPAQAEQPLSASLVPWRDWTEAELTAAVLLIDKQRITGPIFIEGTVPNDLIEKYQTNYNVALVYDEERKVTILT